uniref:G_PROTEIN_RECEP_F1_2 domain-containing protein n=1 Tax=Rhabditophanes sp. KR3021 TaxID=114890 RepID=A0AC35TL61_9BILA
MMNHSSNYHDYTLGPIKKTVFIISIIKIISGTLLFGVSSLIIYVYLKSADFRKKFTNLAITLTSIADFAFSLSLIADGYISIHLLIGGLVEFSYNDCLLLISPQIICYQFKAITTVAVAFDRYLAVHHPYSYRILANKFRLLLTFVVSILFSIISTLLIFKNTSFAISSSSCLFGTVETASFKQFFIYTNIIGSILVVGTYLWMIASILTNKRPKEIKRSGKKYNKVTKMLTFLLAIYAMCWFFPLLLYETFLTTFTSMSLDADVYLSAYILLSSVLSSLFKFAIYLRYHKDIRKTLHRDFMCFSWLDESNGTAALVLRTGLGLLGATIRPDKEILVDYGYDTSKII